MQLVCPNCGEQVKAEHINIQAMVAVCPHCDTVFEFSLPKENPKRRKVKQPSNLIINDDKNNLHMAFRTNFRLDKDENFIFTMMMSIVITVAGFLALNEFTAWGVAFILPIILIASALYYALGLIVYNQTHIDMNDEAITVSRKPLPNIFRQPEEISLSDVVAIHSEETAISKKEAYDTPRYTVYAETVDGRRKIVVNDVTEDYAYFIARRLDEYLHSDEADPDASRLIDHQHKSENDFDDYDTLETHHKSNGYQ